MTYHLREAIAADKAALEDLIARSTRELGTRQYTSAQLEGALRGAFGVDTQLIVDQTYFVVEAENQFVGCGGWSRRRTLFGGDANAHRDASELDPRTDAARIRAFFVDPAHARKGIATAILRHYEDEARSHGFFRFELMATLPGVPLYRAHGYVAGNSIQYELGSGLTIEFVSMVKDSLPD